MTVLHLGTRVAAFGTYNVPNDGTAGWTTSFAIDDAEPQSVSQPTPESSSAAFQQMFYMSPALDDADHSLSINLLAADGTHYLWIDYMLYEASSSAASPSHVIIDDSDARISYSGGWSAGGIDMDFNGTAHTTQKSGETATIIFNGKYYSHIFCLKMLKFELRHLH